jgi:hypothetical protein
MLGVWCQIHLITTKCCVDVRLIDLKIKFLTAVFLAQLKVPEPEIFEPGKPIRSIGTEKNTFFNIQPEIHHFMGENP